MLALAVSDTGAGIREEELKHIFSLFTRAALEENRDKQKNNATETDHHADNGILRKRKRKGGGSKQDRKRPKNRFHGTGIYH